MKDEKLAWVFVIIAVLLALIVLASQPIHRRPLLSR